MGPSGQVKYPTYIETCHQEVLSYSATLTYGMMDLVELALTGTNPYTSKNSADADTPIAAVSTETAAFKTLTGAIDAETTWAALVDNVTTKINTIVSEQGSIDDEVAAYAAGLSTDLAKSYNRITGVFFELNAVDSSAFAGGLGIIESAYLQDVAKYRAIRTADKMKDRTQVYLQSVQAMTTLLTLKVQAYQTVVQLTDNYARIAVGLKNDETKTDIEFRMKEYLWDLDVLSKGAALIGATSGIPAFKEPAPLDRMLMYASTFASMGTGLLSAGMMPMNNMMGLLPFIGGLF